MANIASEKLFLSGIVRHPDEFYQYCQYLDEDDFSSDGAKLTWVSLDHLMMQQEAKGISKAKIVAAAKALGHTNYLSKVRNGDWLDELFSEQVTVEELAQHFLEVKRQSLIGSYVEATDEVRHFLKGTKAPLSEIISRVEDMIVSKVNLIDKGEHAIVDLTKDARKKIEALAEDPGHLGLDIGYPILQNRIGQFRNGSVSMFVGTTGSGKSQLGLRMAVQTAHKFQLPVLLLDSELNESDQLIRVVAQLAKVPYEIIETGYWKLSEKELRAEGITEQEELDKIATYQHRLKDDRYWAVVENLPIKYVSVSGMGVQDVIPHIRRWLLTKVKPDRKTKVPQCLVVYDYIKLATLDETSGGRIPEWQMHGLNVAALHDMATKYNVPIVTFGQTNNEIDDGIRCVAGGKRISENVTSVTYFKRKSEEERSMDPNGTHMAKVFKARYGKGTHAGYINYNVDLSCGDFQELSTGNVNFVEERRRRMQEQRQQRNDDDE